MVRSALVAAVAALAVAAQSGAQPVAGWTTYSLASTGSYALRYLPARVDTTTPLPAVVFLHGSGAAPGDYRSYLEQAADAAGCVLVLPKSESLAGWGDPLDLVSVVDALALVASELALDPARIAVAGHSSGGAYAVWLAYRSGQRFSAVFTLAAPFLSVAANLDPDGWLAPHRLYYGSNDPNYQHGAWLAYLAQCERLEAACELDVQAGYGHTTWPDSSMAAGLAFLVAQPRRPPGWPWLHDRQLLRDAAPPQPARGPSAPGVPQLTVASSSARAASATRSSSSQRAY